MSRIMEQQELLVSGYARIEYNANIPLALVQKMISFYNEIRKLIIGEYKDQKDSDGKKIKVFKGPTFKILNITFQSFTDECVRLSLSMPEMDPRIEYVNGSLSGWKKLF
eukprot:25691_1